MTPRSMEGTPADLDPAMKLVGNADFVLIGEASHGTHEFYETRALLTQRLIVEKGFQAVAAEADWPDAWRVNEYVHGRGDDADAATALSGFTRFPVWMWRNRDVENFVAWLRAYNDSRPEDAPPAGFYGLDLYSLYRSREAVLRYLEKVDPAAARNARYRYSCFDRFGEDEEAYGRATGFRVSHSCEDEAVRQLEELQRRTWEYRHRDGQRAEDDFLSAEQNARLVRNAEEYYRAMFRGRVNTWNLRDRHMAETLHRLAAHLEARFGRARIVVWAHNSHLGDARATDRVRYGEWNLGQLVRERYTGTAVLFGFTTYTGTVAAASDWGEEHETKRVRPALPGSWEALFHETGIPRFFLAAEEVERGERLERAIGVIYRPETERASHYFPARLAEQFDGILHIDETRAVEGLADVKEEQETAEAPETWPSGV